MQGVEITDTDGWYLVIQRDGTTKEVDRSWLAVRASASTVQ